MGTGIAAAFLARLGDSGASAAGVSTTSAVESALNDFLLDFLTARLRGDFGSIAMAPNPLARIPDYSEATHSRGSQMKFIYEQNLCCSPPQAR
jgi:hypothetical protein